MRYRTDYSAQSLSSEPDILLLDGWQLRYQAFAARADDPCPPVLLLGGAFQSFRSFAGEVSELLAEHPVILLDLPSQGGNLQLAAELSLEDLADLIAAFAERLGLPPLMPIGLSYGSALAALFAARHPRARACYWPASPHSAARRAAAAGRSPGPARRGRPERLRPRRTDRPDQPATAGTYRRLPGISQGHAAPVATPDRGGDRTLPAE